MIMSSTFFATLYSGLITPLMAQLQAMIGTVCSTMQPIALVMLTIWLAFVGADIALGHKTLPGACKDFAIAAGVIVLLQAGQYTQYITNLFLTAVPTTIGEALGGPTNPASALDTVLNTVINGACDVYKVLPAYALKSIALCGAVIVFVVVALISVAFTYGVYMVAAILNVAAVVVGPVFLALTVIPATRRFSAGWFSVLVGGCATQLMALAVIQLMSGAELTMIRGLLAAPPGDANSLVLLWGLAQCGVLLALSTLVVKKIPELSRAIASGVYHGSAGLQAATFGAAKTIAGGAAAGAVRGAGAAVSGAAWLAGGEPGEGTAPWRLTRPVGRSLSRGRGRGEGR